MNELKSLIETASKIVDTTFEPEGQMIAHIFAIDASGRNVLIACPTMADAREEAAFRVGIPAALRMAKFQRWVFFAEAWLASYGADESPAQDLPEHRADRLEVITFAAENLAGERMMASRQIYRAQPGNPGRLMPLVFVSQKAGFVMAQPEAAHG